MPGKSCTTNLLEFMEKTTKVIDAGLPFDIVFLDFAKAFDKVPRERLLEKLRAHKVRGRVLNWIRNWLSGRRQRVVLNGKFSSWADVLSGVPQGSVLGPILFLIFINDLDEAALLIDILRKFADDTKLGQTVGTDQDNEKLQQALDNLCDWADKWGMEFNIKKCKIMHLGHNNPGHVYTMKNQQLENTEIERDIGVNVSNSLKPSLQCAQAAKTAQSVLSQISRAFHYRDRHTFKKLYVQYVRPHLEFAVTAWSPWLEADKSCLEKFQQRTVSMISGLKGTTYEEKLREIGLTTLEERRHQADMLQAFKIIRGFDKVDSSTWFQGVDVSIRTTRSAADPLNLRPQAARLETRRNFFSNRVGEAWNVIPGDIKRSKTVSSFKNAYRRYREKWWRTPRTAKRRIPANGGTTSGTRHIQRDPTWVNGCKQTRNKKQYL
jgi:ribonuclease P/MRP protein subunit RPP40